VLLVGVVQPEVQGSPVKLIGFIRHGEAVHNTKWKLRCIQNRFPDAALTQTGHDQASASSNHLSGSLANPDIILLSPLRRTMQTGFRISAHTDCPMKVCFPAREEYWNSRPNMPIIIDRPQQLEQMFSDLPPECRRKRDTLRADWSDDIAKEERFHLDTARNPKDSVSQLRHILLTLEEKTIVVVTHAGVIKMLLNGREARNCERIVCTLSSSGELREVKE
jgi:broad specificity phosphatase PhoE